MPGWGRQPRRVTARNEPKLLPPQRNAAVAASSPCPKNVRYRQRASRHAGAHDAPPTEENIYNTSARPAGKIILFTATNQRLVSQEVEPSACASAPQCHTATYQRDVTPTNTINASR